MAPIFLNHGRKFQTLQQQVTLLAESRSLMCFRYFDSLASEKAQEKINLIVCWLRLEASFRLVPDSQYSAAGWLCKTASVDIPNFPMQVRGSLSIMT